LTSTGFTIVELLVAFALGLIVAMGSLKMLDTVRQSRRTERLRLELQQNARYALDMLARDLRTAGQRMDPTTDFGVVATIDGTGGTPDTLLLMYAEPDAIGHAVEEPMAAMVKKRVTLTITCTDPVDDIDTDDFVYLASGSARGIALVTNVVRFPVAGDCSVDPAASLGSVELMVKVVDGERHGWLLEGNVGGAVAMKAQGIAYFVDASDPARPQLVRSDQYENQADWKKMPVADLVTDFQVDLVFDDGGVAAEADPTDMNPDNDYEDIDTVSLRFEARTRWQDKDLQAGQTYTRVYSTSVTPRNLLYTRNF
jgi:Tfp pilus assembly protein PilW